MLKALNDGDSFSEEWISTYFNTYNKGSAFDMRISIKPGPVSQNWQSGFRLVGLQVDNSKGDLLLVFATKEVPAGWTYYCQRADKSPFGPGAVRAPDVYVTYTAIDLTEDFLVAVNRYGYFRLAQPPADRSRFPHTCGCGAPAYLGAVPAAAECSSKTCRFFRGG